MSSDDYIAVIEGKHEKCTVEHRFTGGGLIERVGIFPSMKEAMIAAATYMREADYPIEYGIHFFPLK